SGFPLRFTTGTLRSVVRPTAAAAPFTLPPAGTYGAYCAGVLREAKRDWAVSTQSQHCITFLNCAASNRSIPCPT
ncbi:MAG: hypothetical protein NTW99_12305, partial [Chloroflexi bacterium]|nr:hypothetical protein [Chloroflexota bacterium]